MTHARTLLAAFVCVAGTACGSASSGAETLQQFTDMANGVCQSTAATLNAAPVPSVASVASPQQGDLHAIATYFSEVIPGLQSLSNNLRALGTPPSKQAQWSQALAAVSTIVTDAQAAQAAANSGNLEAYGTAYGKFVSDASSLDQAFGAFGATGCTSSTAGGAGPSPT